MRTRLKITVMLGGTSPEREVSLASGAAVIEALSSLGHEVVPLDPQDDCWTLDSDTEIVFLALHGTYGEDGTVQTRLDSMGIPYTGCGPESSRVAFDKILTKERCRRAGVPTPRSMALFDAAAPWPSGWEPPIVLKPSRQGSSVGLQFVDQKKDWPSALADAFRYDRAVLLEERIAGRETTVAILDGEPLPIVEVRPRTGTYDYRNKYTAGATEYFCPADFDSEVSAKIQRAAVEAFHAVDGRDYGRVDVMVRENREPFILEVNTLPGMTPTSLFPKAAAAAGISFPDLCEKMIRMTLKRTPATVC